MAYRMMNPLRTKLADAHFGHLQAPHARTNLQQVRRVASITDAVKAKRRNKFQGYHQRSGPCTHLELLPDGSDVWRIDPVRDMLENGAIGIIPTEGFPALVCDLCNTQAVLTLAAMKDVSPKKPMSILVRNFSDVDTYTLGWPRLNTPGMPDVFSVVRKLLPGSYTFILPASKAMPKVMSDGGKHRQKQRRTVGVRMPAHPVAQGLLQILDRPLLCTSARVEEDQGLEIPDAGSLLDMYPSVDFIVDCGGGLKQVSEPSTVVDMTGPLPQVVRAGKGSTEPFDVYRSE